METPSDLHPAEATTTIKNHLGSTASGSGLVNTQPWVRVRVFTFTHWLNGKF